MWISWKLRDTDLARPIAFEQKVEVFYDQTWGWQLHIADLIANGGRPLGKQTEVLPLPHSGFAVLHICLSYFETIGQYRGARGRKYDVFKAGAKAVLPQLLSIPPDVREKLLKALYFGARCGLYHKSRTGRGVGLGEPPGGQPIDYDPDARVLMISPKRLPRALKRHLEGYRKDLLNPSNGPMRKDFECQFDKDFGLSQSLPNERLQPASTRGPAGSRQPSSSRPRGGSAG